MKICAALVLALTASANARYARFGPVCMLVPSDGAFNYDFSDGEDITYISNGHAGDQGRLLMANAKDADLVEVTETVSQTKRITRRAMEARMNAARVSIGRFKGWQTHWKEQKGIVGRELVLEIDKRKYVRVKYIATEDGKASVALDEAIQTLHRCRPDEK